MQVDDLAYEVKLREILKVNTAGGLCRNVIVSRAVKDVEMI